MANNIFLNKIKAKIELSDKEILFLSNIIKSKKYAKNDYFIKPEQTCSKLGFIEYGLFRVYNISNSGKETTNWLSVDNDYITEILSFVNQISSLEYIQALEETKIHYITNKDLQIIYTEIPDFHIFIKLMYEEILIDLKKNIFSNIHLTANERYENFISTKPLIYKKSPLKYIASFLGLTDSTLSRVRRK